MRARILPSLFADSYAFIAFLEGNERYGRLFRRGGLVTSALNVQEVYAILLQRIAREEATSFARSMLSYVAGIPPEVALEAAVFKRRMAGEKRECSHIDAWGYAAAVALKRKFLTGDSAFKRLTNVEFVR